MAKSFRSRARRRVWTQGIKVVILGGAGVLLVIHGAIKVGGSDFGGGLVFLLIGLFIIALEVGLMAYAIWLNRRASRLDIQD
ncbi:hypothetical protein [Lacisediminihabitans sp.]|jgi:high-affinity Fe2+/Pb2+ permease|uniref:hypothetical protein n=1 Tax=Lacisediminihabitans sp. TaxID=2787631 RepID=UPI002F935480